MKVGRVIKSIKPGAPGSKRFVKRYGDRLVCVRYRGDAKRRVRMTTVEVVVNEGFWCLEGYQNYKRAMSSIRHSA